MAPQYTNYADAWETGIRNIYNVSGQVIRISAISASHGHADASTPMCF